MTRLRRDHVTPWMRIAAVTTVALAPFGPGAAWATGLDIAQARQSMVGAWTGKLEYLDYGAKRWFGIDVKVVVEDQGDGVTLLRKADFDDGPKVGNVRITSISMFDPAKSQTHDAAFRKGRDVSLDTWSVHLADGTTDSEHWVMVEELKGEDDNRPARLRETTTRNGASMITLKEVEFLDDPKQEWIQRNRITLMRTPSSPHP